MILRGGQRVVLRSKLRSQRRRLLAVVTALALLAGLGLRTVQEQVRHGRSPLALLPASKLRAVEVRGLEEPDRSTVAARFADWIGRPLTHASRGPFCYNSPRCIPEAPWHSA